MIPFAIIAQLTIPPKTFTNIAFTFGSATKQENSMYDYTKHTLLCQS
jgi:hypothetical protein